MDAPSYSYGSEPPPSLISVPSQVTIVPSDSISQVAATPPTSIFSSLPISRKRAGTSVGELTVLPKRSKKRKAKFWNYTRYGPTHIIVNTAKITVWACGQTVAFSDTPCDEAIPDRNGTEEIYKHLRLKHGIDLQSSHQRHDAEDQARIDVAIKSVASHSQVQNRRTLSGFLNDGKLNPDVFEDLYIKWLVRTNQPLAGASYPEFRA